MIALNANNVSARDNGLTFKFRGSRKGNFLKIEYNEDGLLDIHLYRVSSKLQRENTVSNVVEEKLRAAIEEMLGLTLPQQ